MFFSILSQFCLNSVSCFQNVSKNLEFMNSTHKTCENWLTIYNTNIYRGSVFAKRWSELRFDLKTFAFNFMSDERVNNHILNDNLLVTTPRSYWLISVWERNVRNSSHLSASSQIYITSLCLCCFKYSHTDYKFLISHLTNVIITVDK